MAEIPDIQSVLNQTVKDVQITRLTAPGENYLSLVYRVDYEDHNGTKKSAVAKKLPTGGPVERRQFHEQAMKNEIRWYKDILPLLKTLGRELEIDTGFYPDYIGSRFNLNGDSDVVDEDSVLILDNLIPLGYTNGDRYKGFDLQTVKAMLRILVNFHALALAAKYKKPQDFKVIKDYLLSTRQAGPNSTPSGGEKKKSPPIRQIFEKLLQMPEAEAYKSNIAELMKGTTGSFGLIECGEEPWLTNIHSDYWLNNVMLKSQEDEPEVKMLDFQYCAYSTYARDLVFFLLTSLEDEVLEEHIDLLLRFYYDELTSIFKRLNIAELELTYEQFLGEVKLAANKCEVGHAMFFCTIIFGPKDENKDVLTGEGNMLDHFEWVVNNMSERHKQKLLLITQIAVTKGWI